MMRSLLIKLALGLVIDLLISIATKRRDDANDPMNQERWQVIVEFLLNVKRTGLP